MATPLTVQLTAVFANPVTDAVMGKVPLVAMVCVRLAGLVIEIAGAGPVIVTLTEATTAEFAMLVAVMLKVAGVGTFAGATKFVLVPVPMVP